MPYHMERRRLRQNFFETPRTDSTTSSGMVGAAFRCSWFLVLGSWLFMGQIVELIKQRTGREARTCGGSLFLVHEICSLFLVPGSLCDME